MEEFIRSQAVMYTQRMITYQKQRKIHVEELLLQIKIIGSDMWPTEQRHLQ